MKQLGRVEYLLRHLRQVLPYVSAAKVCNLALNVIELKLNRTFPRSLPPYIKLEPTPLCQLACPGCAHGSSDLKKQLTNKMHLHLSEVRKIVDSIGDTLFGVSLSLRGEPLLGKDILPIIEYLHAKRVAVSFPTNLSLHLRAEQIDRLVRSGVDTMFVSLDGASKATYGRYRVGGDFDLVLHNVKALAAAKRLAGRTRPRLIWKFVVFEHNRHEVATVQNTYRQLGFDAYELVQDYSSPSARVDRSRHNIDLIRKKKGCYWAWHTAVIRADGEVKPCCHQHHRNFDLGNTHDADIRSIWRGGAYARLRLGFKTMRAPELNAICAECLKVNIAPAPIEHHPATS